MKTRIRVLAIFIISIFAIISLRLFYIQVIHQKIYAARAENQYVSHRTGQKSRGSIFFTRKDGTLALAATTVGKDFKRSYPNTTLASHVLGIVAYNGDIKEGVYGLEKYYEHELSGDAISSINPFAAAFRRVAGMQTSDQYDVVTTIEPEIQSALEATLDNVQKMYSSDGVGGIVMDPKTGAVLAMAYTPNFDPNDPSKATSEGVFRNPSVSDVHEFGSVIKPLVVAAGFDTGVITPDTTYNDATGSIKVGVETIHDFDKKGHGVVTVREIIAKSLNTGMVMVEQKLGQENMRKYFTLYGLRNKTDIDLPSEGVSLTKNLDSNRDIEFAAASFGQGFAVSPVQIIRAFSALANHGVPVNPFVVKEIRLPDGTVIKTHENKILPRAIGAEASKTISDVLIWSVDNSLANGTLKFPHHTVSAKTGTAQMVAPNGKYYTDQYLHSMFAYVPASNPKYLIFLYNINPKGVQYASESLAKPLFTYLRFLISYGTIAPDR